MTKLANGKISNIKMEGRNFYAIHNIYNDFSVSCNRFSETRMCQFFASGTEGLIYICLTSWSCVASSRPLVRRNSYWPRLTSSDILLRARVNLSLALRAFMSILASSSSSPVFSRHWGSWMCSSSKGSPLISNELTPASTMNEESNENFSSRSNAHLRPSSKFFTTYSTSSYDVIGKLRGDATSYGDLLLFQKIEALSVDF